MTDCIFCSIVEGKIPSSKVLETGKVLAFLDINPVNKGHVLVVPKKHFTIFDEVEKDFLDELMHSTQKIAKAVHKATKCDGFNIIINNKEAAGQLVPHVHVHIIPRFEKDGKINAWETQKYGEKELEHYLNEIKKNLK